MSDLTTFLLARIAEDEAAALTAIRASDSRWQVNRTGTVVFGDEWAIADASVPTGTHIARHDPARVLAQCAAYRAIVEGVIPERDPYFGHPDYDPEWVLRALASIYADHEDFDPTWRLG